MVLVYNVKVIDYGGNAQIRIYSEPIGAEKELADYEPEKEIEPFSGNVVKVVKEFSSSDEEENKRISLARTRDMISSYARSTEWEFFVTLTFSPDKVDRKDFKECSRKARYWLNNVRKRFAPDIRYLLIMEPHKPKETGETWHCHALMADTGKLRFVDSGHKRSGQVIYNLENWHYGFSSATRVRDVHRVQRYIVKYMTKENFMLAKGAHRYYVSRNLPKPDKSTFLVEPAEQESLIQGIADSLGLSVVWRSKPFGKYCEVTYVELQ